MKFQSLFNWKIKESFFIPVAVLAGCMALSQKMFRLYLHRIVFYRLLRYTFSFSMAGCAYSIVNCYNWSNKIFHEIVTQPEPNGKYVRTLLKESYPRHWSIISNQLHELGYNFKEMNEHSENLYMPDVTYKHDNSRY